MSKRWFSSEWTWMHTPLYFVHPFWATTFLLCIYVYVWAFDFNNDHFLSYFFVKEKYLLKMKNCLVKFTHEGITSHIIVYYFTSGYLGIVSCFCSKLSEKSHFQNLKFETSGADFFTGFLQNECIQMGKKGYHNEHLSETLNLIIPSHKKI